MNASDSVKTKPFDNVILRLRGNRCLVASVAPPFRTAYWNDASAIASQMAGNGSVSALLAAPEAQQLFLNSLTQSVAGCECFQPNRIGFRACRGDIRRIGEFRKRNRTVVFVGHCSRQDILESLELVTASLGRGGSIQIRFKGWDLFDDWRESTEILRELAAFVYQTRQLRADILWFSDLSRVDGSAWDFVYEYPRLRIGWLAGELERCCDLAGFARWQAESSALANLQRISEHGLWPHIVLPVSQANVALVPELVSFLLKATRGGTIEVVPKALLAVGDVDKTSPALRRTWPDPEKLSQALLVLYQNAIIPLKLVGPISWVTARIDSDVGLPRSPLALGAEIAVLPGGDLYAGEAAIGVENWRIGNAHTEEDNLRWERLDAVPEFFSNDFQPEACQVCDWRYRCGGAEPSLSVLDAQGMRCSHEQLFELYCKPRRSLFEEALWDSAENSLRGSKRPPRETLVLYPDTVQFEPAVTPREEIHR